VANLLTETVYVLSQHDKTPYDVLWVGSRDGEYAISFDEFSEIANIEYDNGYGGQEIATDLVIVGDDWWMDRHEYDGAESWDFHTKMKKSSAPKKFITVYSDESWSSIKEMNRPGGKYNYPEDEK
jgi:hypothetical protein